MVWDVIPTPEAAVRRLLAIKQRPVEKGLILIAADLTQLQDYIDLQPDQQRATCSCAGELARPFTWIVPARATTPAWLTGSVRYPGGARHGPSSGARPCAVPLASHWFLTSANLTGEEPARRVVDIGDALASQLAYILPGEVGGRPIHPRSKDARTGAIIRPS